MPTPVARIARILKKNDDFLVSSHVNPDGDALGSTAAMGHILAALGKRFTLYNASGLPRPFDWLPLAGPILAELPRPLPAWIITLDLGAPDRLGPALFAALARERTIVIDHHPDNQRFGAEHWVDPAMPSVGEMMAVLARELGLALTGPLAQAVYLGMTTDTGFFTYGNTRPATFRLAAELLEGGLELERINELIRHQFTLNRFHLWGEALTTLELIMDGAVGIMRIPASLLARTGTDSQDCDNLLSFARRVRGMRVGLSLREDEPGRIKFSLRSSGEDDVQAVAAHFGGGGHRNAAGGTIFAGIEEARARLVERIALIFSPGQPKD